MPPLTYQTAYDGAVADANLAHRVQVGSVQAARDKWAEFPGVTNTQTTLATAVLKNSAQYVSTWMLVCATDPTIVAAGSLPTDAQILAAIKSAWPIVAGT